MLCSKGIEAGSMKLLTEVAAEAQPQAPIAVLSGSTFAHEVAQGLPTAITLAAADPALAEALVARPAQPPFRPSAPSDLNGAAIGVAVDIMRAIACGGWAGRCLGHT